MRTRWRRLFFRCAAALVGSVLAVDALHNPAAQTGQRTAAAPGELTNRDIGLGGPDQVMNPSGMPVRIEVSWWGLQDTPDIAPADYNWGRYDPVIERAHAAGMKILLLVTYSPPWASGGHDAEEGLDHWFPTPEWDDEWADFVTRLVRRYGDKVTAYEIWNEPNHGLFGRYGSGTDEERKRRYWQLVRLSKAAIRNACGSCPATVIAGGSGDGSRPPGQPQAPESQPDPNSAAAWLDWAYGNGYGDDFDAVALHPYPNWGGRQGPSESSCGKPEAVLFGPRYQPGKGYQQQCGQLAALRAVLVDRGHPHKKIWGTEWGYPTYSRMGADHPSLEMIRDFDAEGVHLWRELDYAGPLFLHSFQDGQGTAKEPCTATMPDPECHYGIVRRDGTPKEPRYSELLATVAGYTPTHLRSGRSLRKWSAMRSPNGRFRLSMRGDGDLILQDSATSRSLWEVSGKDARRLISQPDGNLVLYRDPDRPVAVWETGTWNAGPSTLRLQDDGNLVLYRDSTGQPLWASDTAVQG